MKSYIHFIRHGITEGIEKKWFYGKADLNVTEAGYKELEEFKMQGIYPEAGDAAFYTTGLIRTSETLKAIYGDVENRIIPNMQEINFGDWECKHFSELEGDSKWNEWMEDKTGSFSFPNGESMVGFAERIKKGNAELVGYHRLTELGHRHSGKDAVSIIICHGGTISATMYSWFPDDMPDFWAWTPSTGKGYTVEFENGEPVRYTII